MYSKLYSYQNFLFFFLETGEMPDDTYTMCRTNIFVKTVFVARRQYRDIVFYKL